MLCWTNCLTDVSATSLVGVFTVSGIIVADFRQGGSVDSLWSPRKAGLHTPSRPSFPPQSEQRICLPRPSATARLNPCHACLVLSLLNCSSILYYVLASLMPLFQFVTRSRAPSPDLNALFHSLNKTRTLNKVVRSVLIHRVPIWDLWSSLGKWVMFVADEFFKCFYGALSSTSKLPYNSIVFRRHVSTGDMTSTWQLTLKQSRHINSNKIVCQWNSCLALMTGQVEVYFM